ncbi:helix-turn-helix transcriptional regulator [Henriciella sp.]|uniref:helix-turn-helix domain-containing protein n=1 Tax=Henriciella sp. TaxID=1968823 RepID=UPI0026080660|nr:helix-turn-helix transcriptional regulator [Henriciella sp.]
MDIRVRVGKNLRRLRRAQGWSQEEFADIAGYHRTYISGIERGIRNPTITVIENLAKSLKTTASELVAEP